MNDPIIEVWNIYQNWNRSRFCGAFSSKEWPQAIERALSQKRRRLRVRHFYDRSMRKRIVQVIVGAGYGVRNL